jgi:hypothetical protein
MPVPDYGFMEKPKNEARFGQRKMLSENAIVIQGPSVFFFVYPELFIPSS